MPPIRQLITSLDESRKQLLHNNQDHNFYNLAMREMAAQNTTHKKTLSHKKLWTEHQVYHRLHVLHCFGVFVLDTKDIQDFWTRSYNNHHTHQGWYSIVMEKQHKTEESGLKLSRVQPDR